jgi:hypothetical protein
MSATGSPLRQGHKLTPANRLDSCSGVVRQLTRGDAPEHCIDVSRLSIRQDGASSLDEAPFIDPRSA